MTTPSPSTNDLRTSLHDALDLLLRLDLKLSLGTTVSSRPGFSGTLLTVCELANALHYGLPVPAEVTGLGERLLRARMDDLLRQLQSLPPPATENAPP